MAFPVGEQELQLRISGNYPWQEQVVIEIASSVDVDYTLALRAPDWCDNPQLTLNGKPITGEMRQGYIYLTRRWQEPNSRPPGSRARSRRRPSYRRFRPHHRRACHSRWLLS